MPYQAEILDETLPIYQPDPTGRSYFKRPLYNEHPVFGIAGTGVSKQQMWEDRESYHSAWICTDDPWYGYCRTNDWFIRP